MVEYKNRVLFVGAHPDDIEIGCGGIASKLVREGHAIAFAIASRAANNGAERKEEAVRSAALLGLSEANGNLFFGNICDTTLQENIGDVRGWLKEVSAAFKPDTIFTHRLDGHSDHQAINTASTGCFLTQRVFLFYVPRTDPEPPFSPNFFVDIEQHIDRKLQMCACHESQKAKYVGEDVVTTTAHFFYTRCDGLQQEGKKGYVEAFLTHRNFPGFALQTDSIGNALPQQSRFRGDSVDGVVLLSRIFRTFKQEQFVGRVRRRAALSYLTYLHEDVIHEMRKFALACELCGNLKESSESVRQIMGPAAVDFCTACRRLFCDLAELDRNQIHCCLKSINGDAVETWARSEPIDQRDEIAVHPINQNTVWAALLGRNDGNRTWDLFNCFSSSNLIKFKNEFRNTRIDWQNHYKSVMVFPLRCRRSVTQFDTFGFLALDSRKTDAFQGMPEIFEHLSEKDEYHDKARLCTAYQAGAVIADTLSMFLRPTITTIIKSNSRQVQQ
jgi:LmbE family N-acetylglucosaminyl deacetylase